ncbi:Vacuolar protein-sorting-associated protein 60 [Rhizina undulata]
MNRLFGTKSTAPKPTLQSAIGNIDSRVESIDVQLAKLNAELTAYQQKMSKMRDGPGKTALKQKAIKVLQRRKMYESQKEQLEQQSWNMQQAGMMQDNLKSPPSTFPYFSFSLLPFLLPKEYFVPSSIIVGSILCFVGLWKLIKWMPVGRRSVHTDVMTTVDAMKTANKELQKQYGKINIDQITKLQDEMADLMDIGNDIQESISRSYDIPEDVDEAELDAELEALGEEVELSGGWEADSLNTMPSFLQNEPASGLPDFIDEPPTAGQKLKETAA